MLTTINVICAADAWLLKKRRVKVISSSDMRTQIYKTTINLISLTV